MAVCSLGFLFLLSLARHTVGIRVAPSSPCTSQCQDTSKTVSEEIVCNDTDFTNTSTGIAWKSCMSCLQNSTYSQDGESDQAWFLYNLRFSFDTCIFAYPNETDGGSSPCQTSTACGPLQSALEYGNLSTNDITTNGSSYCNVSNGAVTGQYYESCLGCLSDIGSTNYVANALVALEANCLQHPNSTEVLGLSGSVFSGEVIGLVNSSAQVASKTSTTATSPLSMTAIVGIAIGGGVLLLAVIAVSILRCRKSKNRSTNGRVPRWARNKRRSSFSFKCRNILASPISPKFFTDAQSAAETSQQQNQQPPYDSLNALMSQSHRSWPAAEGQYLVETNSSVQRNPHGTAPETWSAQDPILNEANSAGTQAFQVHDQWNNYNRGEKRSPSKKRQMTINTSEAKLAPPPPAHPSPKENHFNLGPSSVPPTTRFYAPVEHMARPSQDSFRGVKPNTTTMSSQGSGYPSRRSPVSASPVANNQQQRTWPSPRGDQEPWFPPPPSSSDAPSSPPRFGRRVSPGTMKKGKTKSGSPVMSNNIQTSFPGPPRR